MRVVAALMMAIIMTGCASVGNEKLRAETEESVATKIVEGKTTKAEVKGLFGSPSRTSFTDSGMEIWNYEFVNVAADAVSYIPIVGAFGGSVSGTKKELVVLFDLAGIVKRYTMSASDVSQKTGLLNN